MKPIAYGALFAAVGYVLWRFVDALQHMPYGWQGLL